MTADARFSDALGALEASLPTGRWMVIGGVAVVARGVARTTRDLDIALDGSATNLQQTLDELGQHGVVARIADAVTFAERTQVLLARHDASALDIDITLAWSPFEAEALRLAPSTLLAGVRVPVARAEDLVVYKLIGGRPVDLADAEELVALHLDALDIGRVGALVDQVAEALDDPGRVHAWTEILRRVRGLRA